MLLFKRSCGDFINELRSNPTFEDIELLLERGFIRDSCIFIRDGDKNILFAANVDFDMGSGIPNIPALEYLLAEKRAFAMSAELIIRFEAMLAGMGAVDVVLVAVLVVPLS